MVVKKLIINSFCIVPIFHIVSVHSFYYLVSFPVSLNCQSSCLICEAFTASVLRACSSNYLGRVFFAYCGMCFSSLIPCWHVLAFIFLGVSAVLPWSSSPEVFFGSSQYTGTWLSVLQQFVFFKVHISWCIRSTLYSAQHLLDASFKSRLYKKSNNLLSFCFFVFWLGGEGGCMSRMREGVYCHVCGCQLCLHMSLWALAI